MFLLLILQNEALKNHIHSLTNKYDIEISNLKNELEQYKSYNEIHSPNVNHNVENSYNEINNENNNKVL